MQETVCCDGWIYRGLHVLVGVVLLSAVGSLVGWSEPQLVGFILDRLPVDNPVTRHLLAATGRTTVVGRKPKKKKI